MNIVTGIYPDFTEERFISLEHAKAAGCKYSLGPIQTGISDRVICDIEGKPINIAFGKWILNNPSINFRSKSSFNVVDPRGAIDSILIDGHCTVKKLFEKMNPLSKYASWNEVKMQSEIDRLIAENNDLKTKIELMASPII